jgi:murein DD-endopeptidase MepM/ murein hydrolase activator NlpD
MPAARVASRNETSRNETSRHETSRNETSEVEASAASDRSTSEDAARPEQAPRVGGTGDRRPGGPAVRIQPKLTVNEPGDKYEKEAERVADAVMRMDDATETGGAPHHRLGDGEQDVIYRRATAESAANAAARQQMGEISIPSSGRSESTSQEAPSSSDSAERPSTDRPMDEAERQISAMQPSKGQQDPLSNMYTIQAASRYHNGCNGLFGDVRGGDCTVSHTGTDYYAPVGTSTYAVTNGRVVRSYIGGYGNSIVLQERGGEKSYFYAHLSGYNVEDGAEVEEGQEIGQTGASGNASSDRPHLHFEVRPGGRWASAEDPMKHGFPTPMNERVYDNEEGWHIEDFNVEDCDCYAG